MISSLEEAERDRTSIEAVTGSMQRVDLDDLDGLDAQTEEVSR